MECLPTPILTTIDKEHRPLKVDELHQLLDDLVSKVYEFETGYVNSFIEKKEYDKYLKYVNIGPQPKVVIAPYFMLKKQSKENGSEYLQLNKECLQKFVMHCSEKKNVYPIAAQLVMDKEVLLNRNLISQIKETYDVSGYEYIFIWISDFSTFDCSHEEKEAFYTLIDVLNQMGKKPLMAYGGYDAILLSRNQMKARLYGTAQSVGYGEARAITPVGGGLPVNKYYFGPLHKRMRFDEALNILMNAGYFDDKKSNKEHAEDYYLKICNCKTCNDIIKDDIDNFKVYNDSTPYVVKARYGNINRNRPTMEATLVAAFHFLHCKNNEWLELEENELSVLIEKLIENFRLYGNNKELLNIEEWCEVFGK